MKKLLGLAVVCGLLASGSVQAASYRVDFSGTGSDGAIYDGYFTFDTAGLNLDGVNEIPWTFPNPNVAGDGFATSFLYSYADDFGNVGSYDETTGGVSKLAFTDGELTHWTAGGYVGGYGVNVPVPLNDFLLCTTGCTNLTYVNGALGGFYMQTPTWEVAELSAVPLPGAVWAFGAGLLGLLGLKRRRKTKMLRTATA
ncbi:hypothetical protein [Sneathiella litorea]|uniref:VPLPA-CTERM protein sorting domain-containing protein n=1 Tax=Sneathiella litorea TaxID=2606216 RepID=A0A6L8W794_9PROT|nr:hypothetical protein [Sneathiella litorea]MZR30270.1 hypothetical protein [Sneathiella litorea]